MDEKERKSTLVRRGFDAITFADMATFAAAIETRPLEKLLDDLPGLAELSDAKFDLAVNMLRRRFASHSEIDRDMLRTYAETIAAEVEDEAKRERILKLFA